MLERPLCYGSQRFLSRPTVPELVRVFMGAVRGIDSILLHFACRPTQAGSILFTDSDHISDARMGVILHHFEDDLRGSSSQLPNSPRSPGPIAACATPQGVVHQPVHLG